MMLSIVTCYHSMQNLKASNRMLTNLEQGSVVRAAVVFISMRIQQAGVARRNKDGCLIQACA